MNDIEPQTRPELVRGPIRYRNHFRWRVMPPDGAFKHGYFDQSFANKRKAVEHQKRVKKRFPGQPCCLVETGAWYTYSGAIIR